MFSLSRSFRCQVLIWLGAAFCVTAAGQGTLRVCADPNNLPFSNNTGQGLENKLAQLIAQDLSVDLKYVWFSERKNFLKHSLNDDLCDAVLGVPVGMDDALLTRPYYRSTYVVFIACRSQVEDRFHVRSSPQRSAHRSTHGGR